MTTLEMWIWKWPIQKWKSRNWKFGMALLGHRTYSYRLKCANYSHYKYNWLKYIAAAYVPLTVFFFVAIIFRLNALSASMNAIILFSQLASSPAVVNMISTFAYFSNTHLVDHDINLMSVADVVAIPFSILFSYVLQTLLPSSEFINNSDNVPWLCYSYVSLILDIFNIGFMRDLKWLGYSLNQITHLNHQWNASTSLVEAFATFILM